MCASQYIGKRRSKRLLYQPVQPPAGSPVLASEYERPKPDITRKTGTGWKPSRLTATQSAWTAQPIFCVSVVG